MAASTSDVGLPVGDGLGQEEFDEDGEDEEDVELLHDVENSVMVEVWVTGTVTTTCTGVLVVCAVQSNQLAIP